MKVPLSFRAQLTLLGSAAIYLPVLALYAVGTLTEDVDVTTTGTLETVATSNGPELGWVELALVLLAPVAVALAWWWAGRAVRPIERIRAVAEGIQASDLGARIALTSGPAELVHLAASFDAMLDRLHRAASHQRAVLDDLSHELRTPIAVLVTNADVRLARPRPDPEWLREGLEQSRRTAERLQVVLDRLLVDARGVAHTIDRHPADLMEIVRAVGTELRVVAAERDVAVTVEGPDRLSGSWDSATMSRAVTNLLDNAVRHAPAGGEVRIRVQAEGGSATIAVSDDGPGIPEDQLASVFERSWRHGDGAGRGLGLAIARQVAEAHGGTLTVRSPDPHGASTTFLLTVRGSAGEA